MYDRMENLEIVEATEGVRGWSIECKGGTGFMILCDDVDTGYWNEIQPKKGDEITLYTRGFSFIVGIDLNGKRLFLKTADELEAENTLARAKSERVTVERLERERPRLDADYESLPQVFKDRIDRFRNNNPDFRRKYESYEMFCCTEAVKVAESIKAVYERGIYKSVINAFWASEKRRTLAAYPDATPWEEPEHPLLRVLWWARALNTKAYDYDYKLHLKITGMSEGHSGNTAAAAMALAELYIKSPEFVSKLHGALSPLVGSAEYGDIDCA